MDEHNGECSDHQDDMYGSVNALDFLLEPQDSLRNVPCSTLNSEIDDSDILSKCIDVKVPPNNYPVGVGFANCIDPENSSKVSTESANAIGSNCSDIFGLVDHQSSLRSIAPMEPIESMDLSERFEESQANKNLMAGDRDSAEGISRAGRRTADNVSVESEITAESDVSTVQTCSKDNIQSTNFVDISLECSQKVSAGDSEYNSQDTQDEESDEREKDTSQEHLPEVQSTSKVKLNRGRKRRSGDDAFPKTKRRQPAVTYQSQISPDQNGIKLKIKKASGAVAPKATKRRERVRKRRIKREGDETTEGDLEDEASAEQSKWGSDLPLHVLVKVFALITRDEGCLPFLVRASSVCHLWREAALSPSLWHTIDLTGPWVNDRYKSEAQLIWLCENRFSMVEDLNVGGWKMTDKQRVLSVMATHCHNLRGLSLQGWNGLNGDHLKFLVDHCPLLSRLDLSTICPDGNMNRSAVSMTAVRNLCQTVGNRLTHLLMADNRITGVNQIVSAIAGSCPNLEVLDLSNLWSNTTAALHVEKLQEGCQLLRVLRLSNSNLCLASTSLKEQVASPGFPSLEELSVASISGLDGILQRPVMDDESIERILKTSHKLRLLDVRGCWRISDSSLVRVPAWDLEHLFLSGCYVTKMASSGLELIVQKWSHSLVEMDLAWSTATTPLDSAVTALAERGTESQLRVLNLCGSSVSLEPVKAVLLQCPRLQSLNLSSCRALPRGMKRLYEGFEVAELRSSLLEKSDASAASPEEASANILPELPQPAPADGPTDALPGSPAAVPLAPLATLSPQGPISTSATLPD